MSLTKHNYAIDDLEEQDLDTAPSLDIPAIRIEKLYMPKDKGKYMLFFASVIPEMVQPKQCDCCKRIDTMVLAGNGAPRLIHDVVRNNYKVDIVLRSKRFQCSGCRARETPQIPGIEEHRQMTTRLLEHLQIECFLQPHTLLAETSGYTVQTIQNIMNDEIDKMDADRLNNPLQAPYVLGIDEKHIANIMRGTLVDVKNGVLLDLLENNKADAIQEAIKRLKNWDTDIKVVTTDMNNAYLSWLPTLLPNATFVIDKFHVVKDVQKKVSKTVRQLYRYRKKLISQLETEAEKTQQNLVLQNMNPNHRLFNYSMDSIVREENSENAKKLATVIDEFPEFKLLRKLSYAFELIYQQETLEDAEAKWDEWMELLPPNGDKKYQEWCDLHSVEPPLFDEFRTFSRSGFLFFKPYILNYFKTDCRYTNAATEGLNTKIEKIDRNGHGLTFKNLRAKCLYASGIHKRIQYGIQKDVIKMRIASFRHLFNSDHGSYHNEYIRKTVYEFTATVVPVDLTQYVEGDIHLWSPAKAPNNEEDASFTVDEKNILAYAEKYFEKQETYWDQWKIN